MKTVHITAGFTGYPAGKKRQFKTGDEPELSNEYADLIVGKGLARELPAKADPKPAPSTTPATSPKD